MFLRHFFGSLVIYVFPGPTTLNSQAFQNPRSLQLQHVSSFASLSSLIAKDFKFIKNDHIPLIRFLSAFKNTIRGFHILICINKPWINLKAKQKEVHQAILQLSSLWQSARPRLVPLTLGLKAGIIWGKNLGGLESSFCMFSYQENVKHGSDIG